MTQKIATYDAAEAARVVRIYWPIKHSDSHLFSVYTREGEWPAHELALFDLAERRSYRMEVVE